MDIVKKSYMKAVLEANRKRKEKTAQKLDFYFNEQEEYLLEMLKENYKSNAINVLPIHLNIVKKIIDLKSAVYIEDAKRAITGTEHDQAIYSHFEDTGFLPVVMKQANRLCNLSGTVLLRPVFRRGRMEIDLLTANNIDVTLGDSPNDVTSITITHFSENGRPNEVTYSVWTDTELVKLDYNGKEFSREPNPYGIIPFVVVHNSLPIDDFWLDGSSNDLVSTQNAINMHLSGVFYTLFYQGHATGWIKGAGDTTTNELLFGAGSMISLPENGDVGFVSPQSRISEAVQAITFLLEQVAIQNGLPASVITSSAREISGVTLITENAELAEARRDQLAIFARAEQDLFHLFKLIWNTHSPQNKISDEATLRVDFADPQPSMTPLDKFYLFEKEYRLGMKSPVDYLMSQNPDYTHDDAYDKLIEISAENDRLSSLLSNQTKSSLSLGDRLR